MNVIDSKNCRDQVKEAKNNDLFSDSNLKNLRSKEKNGHSQILLMIDNIFIIFY